jgi:AcrR family transcriptional regulator
LCGKQPRERRFQRTRQAILDAALEIIREEGPAALNMRALAERSDYSAAGLYEYFGGKDEIIVAVSQQGHERLTSHMRMADASLPVMDYLYEIGMGYIRFALENPDHFLLMFTVAPPGQTGDSSPEQLLEGDSSFHILLDAIRRGIAEGAFVARPGFGLMEMAYAAWAMVHGIAMLRLTSLRGYPMDFEAADRATLRNFAAGLQSAA